MSSAGALSFGDHLRHARRAAGLTQEELAERAGVAPETVSALERGVNHAPHRDTVEALGDALGLTNGERERLVAAARGHLPDPPHAGAAPVEHGHPPLPEQRLLVGGYLGSLPEGPLAARETERTQLGGAIEQVACGAGRTVMIEGEPGIGKTRLAQEATLLAHAHGFLIVTGRCFAPQATVAYYPFLEALSRAREAASEALRTELPQRWPSLARLLPDSALALPEAPAGSEGGSGREEQQRLFWQVTAFLQELATARPLALLLDDLHWADGASIALAQHLAQQLREHPVLLLGTYRGNEVDQRHPLGVALLDLARQQLVERVPLTQLPVAGLRPLVAAALGRAEAPAGLAELLHARTNGNPFFAHEILRALVARGDLLSQDGRWDRGTLDALELPETVRAVITQRLSHIGPAAQEVLCAASVLGQAFAFDDLHRMDGHDEGALEAALEAAQAAVLVHETGSEGYSFHHALTQQALYTGLHARKRRRLHRAAAEAIAGLEERTRTRRAAELAYHFSEAGEGALALPYALLAGDQARALYANDAAERAYQQAVTLAQELGDRAREAQALEGLAWLQLWARGQFNLAHESFDRALKAYRACDDPAGQRRMSNQLARACVRCGKTGEAIALLEPLARHGAPPEMPQAVRESTPYDAMLLVSLADAYYAAGRYEDQLAVTMQAEDLVRTGGNVSLLASVAGLQGTAQGLLGQWDDAVHTLQRAITLAEMASDLYMGAWAQSHLSDCYERSGQFDLAAPSIAHGLHLVDRLGHVALAGMWAYKRGLHAYYVGEWDAMRAWYNDAVTNLTRTLDGLPDTWIPNLYGYVSFMLGQVSLLTGERACGLQSVEEAITLTKQNGNLHILRKATCELAEAELVWGRHAAARARLEQVLAHPSSTGHTDLVPCLPLLAWAHLQLGDQERAAALLEEATAPAITQHHQLAWLDILRVRALLAIAQGRWSVAQDALDHLLGLAVAMPYPYAEAKARFVAGQLAVAEGEPERARAAYQRALVICDRLGERLFRPAIARALALACDQGAEGSVAGSRTSGLGDAREDQQP
jgi:tetratricopeptide (TPR) repeat protein/transcriptional regulator with XRE-family HTH domain